MSTEVPSSTRAVVHAVHSQVDLHRAYGGVVPELASRDHIRRVLPLIEDVLARAGLSRLDIDAIAVTAGPGLIGALLVGCSIGSALGYALGKPVIGVHHLEGHLLSPLLAHPAPQFPFVALLVSGGHTQLLQVERIGSYRLLGKTVDALVIQNNVPHPVSGKVATVRFDNHGVHLGLQGVQDEISLDQVAQIREN